MDLNGAEYVKSEQNAKFLEIERSSMLLSVFSSLDQETGSFLNMP